MSAEPSKEAYEYSERRNVGLSFAAAEILDHALTAAQAERDGLKGWKESAMAVEREWDVQAVGKALGVPLGAAIRPAILPGILQLQAERDGWRGEAERLKESFSITYLRELHAECVTLQQRVATLESQLWEAKEYADKLAAGLPDGMLPKDVELLRDSNAQFATKLQAAESKLEEVERERDEALTAHESTLKKQLGMGEQFKVLQRECQGMRERHGALVSSVQTVIRNTAVTHPIGMAVINSLAYALQQEDALAQSRPAPSGADPSAERGEALRENYDELREFVRTITLDLQKHRSLSDPAMYELFQKAYRLYVAHKVEQPAAQKGAE